MKCPHCGMNIRDNVTECGYCGGKITRRPERTAAGSTRPTISGGSVPPRGGRPAGGEPDESDAAEGEDEGLSPYLQPGEQVLIGSLNVTVKKFFFHAYLTNQRIFLIDIQEKKLKVTAKDVPRDTIAGSIVEFSESSDPVLVLSIRSPPDDEIKTMKLVFVQNGMDRSAEIDEWIALLQDEQPVRKPQKKPVEEPPAPAFEEESPHPPPRRAPEKPVARQELHPARKPVRHHEKQPPVKRLLTTYTSPEEPEPPVQEPEPEPEVPVSPPIRRAQVRQVPEPVKKSVVSRGYERETLAEETDAPPVRKPEVQSAMKVAMKGAMKPLQQHPPAVRRPVPVEPAEPEPAEVPPTPQRRPVVEEGIRERPVHSEETASPQFCHNCGKKLPHAANFCPGCGTKLSQSRTLPHSRHTSTVPEKRTPRTDPPAHEHRTAAVDDSDDEETGEMPVPAKPPIKRAPKGSEMTILHKFLRR